MIIYVLNIHYYVLLTLKTSLILRPTIIFCINEKKKTLKINCMPWIIRCRPILEILKCEKKKTNKKRVLEIMIHGLSGIRLDIHSHL